MLYRIHFAFLYSSLILISNAADHELFKNCSRIDFCTNLRARKPSDSYKVQPDSFKLSENSIAFTLLKNTNNSNNLQVSLTPLVDNTFRLQIQEPESSRYQLRDVLDGEPETLKIEDASQNENYFQVKTGSSSAIIEFSPFNIKFFKEGANTVIFEGRRLFMHQDSEFTLGLKFPGAFHLSGLKHAHNVDLQSTGPGRSDPYRLKNSDVAYHDLNSPMALYGAVPVLYANSLSSTCGVFLHNAAEQWIEINKQHDNASSEAYFMVETGSFDLFIFLGPDPVSVVRQYTKLTGKAHLPQLWTLGYHQSKYNYENQDEVKEVVSNFDSHEIQLDSIWLDIRYTDRYKYFTWNPVNFSAPEEMQEALDKFNRKLVTIIDPHVKVEKGYNVYDGALEGDFFVKNPNGSVFEGPCWPGLSSYIDFLNPKARDYYASFYHYDKFLHSTATLAGIWNDMNEPSVFISSTEQTLPADTLHFGGVKHKEIHNIYGLLNTKATHQGLLERDGAQKRPFVLTRSLFAGSQRYAAHWTGDNVADWGYLSISYSQCANSNMLGLVFCGADIGGFFETPSEELLQRWYQAGAWLPFYRGHYKKQAKGREPYLFSEDVQKAIRSAIQMRYKHLPVWYTLFFEHSLTGDPIVRPLWYHYRGDVEAYGKDKQILIGSKIMVCPVMEPGVDSIRVYLPGVESSWWYSLVDEKVYKGARFIDLPVDIKTVPVFYKGGSVVVLKETVRRNTEEMVNDEYTLHVTFDKSQRANGTIYVDDNVSFEYRDSQKYTYLEISVDFNVVSFSTVDKHGAWEYDFKIAAICYNNIFNKAENGEPQFAKEAFTKDADGKLLKDIKINPKETTSIKLFDSHYICH